MHCNLKAVRRCASRSGLFRPNFTAQLHVHKLLYTSVRSDIGSRFIDPYFLKESNNLAIRWHFHAVTLTFVLLTLNVCSTSGVTWSKTVSISEWIIPATPKSRTPTIDIHCVSKVSLPFLFLWLFGQMLIDFNNIWQYCS